MNISKEQIENLVSAYGTPIYVYEEEGIRKKAQLIKDEFSKIPGYKNYFAVKATPTPAILKILHEEGMGFDCSTASELEIMKRMNISGKDIFYTSNNTPAEDFEKAIELSAIVNIDDLTQVQVFIESLKGKSYGMVALRYNPGELKSGNAIIGNPVESKYGMRPDQFIVAVKMLAKAGVKNFGLHTMVASNELDSNYFAETATILVDAAAKIEVETGITFSLINLGGGFGVNYQPDQNSLRLSDVASAYLKASQDLHNVDLVTENGRLITGPHGYLITKVRYVMEKYKSYIGLDASMHNLMRPGMYGSYHKITLLDNSSSFKKQFDVVGSLCENNDKFAIDRELPSTVKSGDIAVIHDVGAHGHAMGFNYNGLLRSAEVLIRKNGESMLIRRAETADDYLRNIVW